jgi:CheY-like chemotaxis protein
MRTRSVLIVEDNIDNRSIYSTILLFVGYSVLEAENGAEGVRLATEYRPDLILMDLSMPVLDGWGAIARLKADPATSDIPVCALSAHVPFGDMLERARTAGFTCYLTKPIEPKEVLKEVAARIGPATRARRRESSSGT